MPVIQLTEEQEEHAVSIADSDLKYLLADVGVPEYIQSALFHRGYTSIRLLAGIDESRTEVRAAVTSEIGLDQTASNQERRHMALVLAAWETARTQQTANDQSRAEARAAMVPRPLPLSEHAQLREALEMQLGRLKDYEVPAKSFLSAKLDDIETNMPRLEDLRDVASVEDGEADTLQGSLDPATGLFKMKPARTTISMPKNPKELRLRHRRLGLAWQMARTKHRHKVWLQGDIVEAYRRLSDHILGKHCHGIALPGERRPEWSVILSYEQEIRKRAYQWVRQGDVATLEDGILRGIKDAETMNLHFIIPLTTSAASSSNKAPAAPKQGTQPAASPKGTAKGRGKGNKATKKLHVKTADGKAICFKYNNGDKCPGGCGFVHICQRCLGSHPKSKCSQLRGAPRKSDTRAHLEELCAAQEIELQMDERDLLISEGHDLSDEDIWQELAEKIKSGYYDIILMSPPCSTWSRALWANRHGPNPVRSREFPWGFPWLSGAQKDKAELGTILVMRCIEVLNIAPPAVICFWEHPEDLGRARNGTPASVWQLDELRQAAKRRKMETVAIHQCAYGADYPKPTRLLSDAHGLLQVGFHGWPVLNKDLYYMGPLPRACGQNHDPLIGTNEEGQFKTAPTAAYPPQMNNMIATLVFNHWLRALPSTSVGKGVEQSARSSPKTTAPTPDPQPTCPAMKVGQEDPSLDLKDSSLNLEGAKGHRGLRLIGGKPFHDGAGLCSQGNARPAFRQEHEAMLRLGEELLALTSEEELRRDLYRLSVGKCRGPPFRPELVSRAKEIWLDKLERLTGVPKKELEVVEHRQPFMLAALGAHLKAIGDPDAGAFEKHPGGFRRGVVLGVDAPLPRVPQLLHM
eukprot:s235_g2.t1